MKQLIKLFKTNKLFQKITCLVIAFAMLLSFNYGFAYSCVNFAKNTKYGNVTSALYAASSTNTYNFTDTTTWSTPYVSGNSSNRASSLSQSLIDFKDSNEMQPSRFYYGASTSSSTQESEPKTTGTDNYASYIALKDYSVARKSYKSNQYNTVTDNSDNEYNVVYVYPASDTNLESAQQLVNLLNAQIYGGIQKYVLQVKDTDNGYDSDDYSVVDAEKNLPDEYKIVKADVAKLNDIINDTENNFDGKPSTTFDLGLYGLYLKKAYDYVENYMYFRTLNTSSFSANSYYVVSVWVYTNGQASATLRVNSSNGYIDAKVSNITTNGLWQQYNLFIETRAAEASSIYIYLYYGDENGVTGTKTLDSFETKHTDTNGDAYSTYDTLTGSIYFDNLQVYQINSTEYTNQTINGKTTDERAKASIARGYWFNNTDDNHDGDVVISGYDFTADQEIFYNFASDDKQLSYNATYSARHYLTAIDSKYGNYNFDNMPASGLVNQTYTGDSLDFDSYINNNSATDSNYFVYYLPRYTTDTGTTSLSKTAREQYRKLYGSALDVSITKEADVFGTYQDYKRDALGNMLDENGNIVTDTTKAEKIDVPFNTFNDNNSILKLQNSDAEYALGVTTGAIRIAQQGYYRISVWVYSQDDDATATVKLMGNIKTGNTETYGTLILTSQTATDFNTPEKATDGYNGWKEISFYVQGNPYYDVNVFLALVASKNSTIYFDNIKVEAVSSTAYTSNTSSRLDLASIGAVTGNITNGYFTNITISGDDATNTYPYTASSWSTNSSDNDTSVIAGVVGTSSSIYEKTLVAAKNEDGEIDYFGSDEIEVNSDKTLTVIKDSVKLNGNPIPLNTTIYPASNVAIGSTPDANKYYYILDHAGNYAKATTLKAMFGGYDAPTTSEYGIPRPASNVYAMNFQSEDSSTYYITSANIGNTSSSSSLNADSVYKITFQAWFTQGFTGTFVANLKSSTNVIANIEFTIDEDTTDDVFGKWQTFTIYFRTGGVSRSSITLQLGAKEANGVMFMQDVNHKSLAATTDKQTGKEITINEQFEQALAQAGTINKQNSVENGVVKIVKFVDMLNNNFTAYAWQSEDGIYKSYSHSQETLADDTVYKYTQGILGVINTNTDVFTYTYQVPDTSDGAAADATTDETITIENPANSNTEDIKTALLLLNTKSTDYTYAASSFNTALASNSYFKISVDVKTSDLGSNGLKIIANGITESFSGINKGEYTTYTFYVHTGSSSVSTFSLDFQLGTNNGNSFIGWALISNMQVATLTEDEYTDQTTADGVANDKTIIVKNLATSSTSSDGSGSGNSTSFSWATFFLVLSSILLVVALVIAIVGTVIKRNSKKLKAGEAGIVSASNPLGSKDTDNTEGIN